MRRPSRTLSFLIPALSLLLAGCREESSDQGTASAPAASTTAKLEPAPAANSAEPGRAPRDTSPFEGEVKLSLEGGDEGEKARTFTAVVKGKKTRFDMPVDEAGGGAFAVLDLETQKMLSVVPAQKMAVEMDLKKFRESMRGFLPASDDEPMNFRKTDRRATIAGHECVDWEGASKDGDTHVVCLAELGASWFSFPTDQFPVAPDFAKEMFDGAHVPLRVVHAEKGKRPVRMEVVSLVRMPVDDARFSVPEGFRRVDLNQAMGALGGLSGMAADLSKQAQASGGKMTPEMQRMMEQMQKQAEAARKAAGSGAK